MPNGQMIALCLSLPIPHSICSLGTFLTNKDESVQRIFEGLILGVSKVAEKVISSFSFLRLFYFKLSPSKKLFFSLSLAIWHLFK